MEQAKVRLSNPEEAAEALRSGKVALVPTETVVGLVAGKEGLHRLAGIKGRDPEKPIALICALEEQALGSAKKVPSLARKLAGLYWPGPLTLVLDHPDGGTVGVRVPAHPVVQALLSAYGEPLYATSANISGEAAPASLDDVDTSIRAAVDLTLEGEPGSGEASAVVDLSGGKVQLLRPTERITHEFLRDLAEV